MESENPDLMINQKIRGKVENPELREKILKVRNNPVKPKKISNEKKVQKNLVKPDFLHQNSGQFDQSRKSGFL